MMDMTNLSLGLIDYFFETLQDPQTAYAKLIIIKELIIKRRMYFMKSCL